VSKERILRALLVADIAITILAVPYALVDDRLLPPALQAYAAAQSEAPLSLQETVLVTLALPLLALVLVAWIGLFRWWRVAPALYLTACVGAVAILLMGGPTVETALSTAADTSNSIISGMILGLVYFSELRERFGASAQRGTSGVA
jgi:hypothetical protein